MIFDAFIRNPAPDNWDGFSELMVQLGFVMDAEKSFEEYAAGCGIHMKHAATKRDKDETTCIFWSTQIVKSLVIICFPTGGILPIGQVLTISMMLTICIVS